MFDTLLIITLFLLASFPVCLLTSRLLFLMIVYFTYVSLAADINGYFEIPTPLGLLNLTKISNPAKNRIS